jgi:hypothetical protein
MSPSWDKAMLSGHSAIPIYEAYFKKISVGADETICPALIFY